MDPWTLGTKYDRIAQSWHVELSTSSYGLNFLKKAISYCSQSISCLDVGCGAGGRFIHLLEDRGFTVTGLDVSAEMLKIAKQVHPKLHLKNADITTVEMKQNYDLIVAWDSIFHLPLNKHEQVLRKLASCLNAGGVLLYTFGDTEGEHTDTWHDDQFYYSSIGVNGNLATLLDSGLKPVHLEMDQFPLNHVVVIAVKPCGEKT